MVKTYGDKSWKWTTVMGKIMSMIVLKLMFDCTE